MSSVKSSQGIVCQVTEYRPRHHGKHELLLVGSQFARLTSNTQLCSVRMLVGAIYVSYKLEARKLVCTWKLVLGRSHDCHDIA